MLIRNRSTVRRSDWESARYDGLLVKGGFVSSRLRFATSGLLSPLARAQTWVRGLFCCLEAPAVETEFCLTPGPQIYRLLRWTLQTHVVFIWQCFLWSYVNADFSQKYGKNGKSQITLIVWGGGNSSWWVFCWLERRPAVISVPHNYAIIFNSLST